MKVITSGDALWGIRNPSNGVVVWKKAEGDTIRGFIVLDSMRVNQKFGGSESICLWSPYFIILLECKKYCSYYQRRYISSLSNS
jgi:hypothetical protein